MIGVFTSRDKLGKRVIIVFRGLPCSWGRCRFCGFQVEQTTSLRIVLSEARRLVEEARRIIEREGCNRITVFNGGSFSELPLDVVLELSKITRGLIVDIEERPEFLDLDKIRRILGILEPMKLVVRVGLEVASEEKRNKLLGKGISDEEVERLIDLRLKARIEGLPVEFIAYVLFSYPGILEEEVMRSVDYFNKVFDGVIAIRYRRLVPWIPVEAPVSSQLASWLEENTLMVDWTTGEEWSIGVEGEGQAPRLSS